MIIFTIRRGVELGDRIGQRKSGKNQKGGNEWFGKTRITEGD